MEFFAYHVFVCEQRKPDGLPCCSAHGSSEVLEALRREVAAKSLHSRVMVTGCGSLGLCERGPNMVVYPEGIWYSGVTVEDVHEIVESHFEQGVPVRRLANSDATALKNEIATNRNRYLQSLRAKETSGAVPDDLMQTVRGYQDSRVVLSALELDAFNAVAAGATAADAAATMKTDARATAMLLDALTAMSLLEKRDGIYRPAAVAARHLVAGAPFDARAALRHNLHLWRTWSTLTDAVRTGTAVGFLDMAARDEDWAEPFIAAMHRNALDRAPSVVAAVGASDARRMLDVGGGSGAWSIAFAQAAPEMTVEILDLPPVLAIAQRHVNAAGLAGRITLREGDLRSDDFGTAYDLVFISAICHMLSEAENRDLMRRAYAATTPGGRVVIQDFILEADRTAPRQAALFALNMLVGTESGNSYTEGEYTAWLSEAGYSETRRVRLPGPAHLMIARRPV